MKNISIVTALLGITLAINAQNLNSSNQSHDQNKNNLNPKEVKDQSSGCIFYSYNQSVTLGKWTGGCLNGLISGEGEMITYINDTIYMVSKCTIKNGYKNGHSIDSFYDGTKYIGNNNLGFREGKGKMIYPDGAIYEGEWRMGLREGQGKMIYSDGSQYDGEWKANTYNGRGKTVTKDGHIHMGNYRLGLMEGNGKYTMPDGSFYDGEWKANKIDGIGVYQNVNGSTYIGNWKNGNANGQGKTINKDGSYHVGSYMVGKMHGMGKYVFSDSTYYEGYFESNEIKGIGKKLYPDGSYYVGEWQNNKRNGKGKLFSRTGQIIYEGNFENDSYPEKKDITGLDISSNNSMISKIFGGLTRSEYEYVEKLLTSTNDDPKGIVGTKCGVAYTKCQWCGKSFAYNKTWGSRIQSIKALRDPFGSALGNLYMSFGSMLGLYDEKSAIEKWVGDLKNDLKKIKAGQIYVCSESTPPKYCSKKCQYEKAFR